MIDKIITVLFIQQITGIFYNPLFPPGIFLILVKDMLKVRASGCPPDPPLTRRTHQFFGYGEYPWFVYIVNHQDSLFFLFMDAYIIKLLQ